MEIGVFSGCIAGETFEEKFSELKRIGYDFLELSTKAEYIEALPEGGDELREASKAAEMPVLSANLGNFPSFSQTCRDADARKELFAGLDAVCDLLAEWGPGAVLLLPVWEGEGGMEVEDAYIQNLTAVGDRAESRSVRLALEHIGSSKFCPKASEILALVRKVGHGNIGFYFDIGNCQMAGEDPVKVLETAGGDLYQVHLKGTRDTPFDQMPLTDIEMLLGNMGFKGRAAVEIPAHGDNTHLEQALELIRKTGF